MSEDIKSWLISNMITNVETDLPGDDSMPVLESVDDYAKGWNDCIRHLLKLVKER